MDVACICKNGQCKTSSGCGTWGAFFFRNCTSCEPYNCEDEGACLVVDGKCREKPKLTLPIPNIALATLPPKSFEPTFAVAKLHSLDNSCQTKWDCWKAGKKCHEITDVGCVCKKGQCKISSGCGTQGAFFFQSCSGCSPEGCEDEGACVLQDGVCQALANTYGWAQKFKKK
eukprot:TRINITY_DN25913_c0_g1_i1.p1 TRINITY_DN25913_c0_g1~~TRINITY_DN25913_c0_g1_i1.p1  ORF type:complete len:198 (-),score=36.32 TRINITY_DN25913_c0_g1_i1:206-721(-)